MSAPPDRAPRVPRRRRAWFDPRFTIGLVLVAASVAGVVGIVSMSDDSIEVYAAREALVPGDPIEEADLVARRVHLADVATLYLREADIDDGLVVTRTVAAGELVPTSAVGDAADADLAAVVVTVAGQLSESIGAGVFVDVWAAEEVGTGVFGAPAIIVASASVVRLVEADGLVVDSGSPSVEVLVPREAIARVLESVANGDALSLVPASLPAGS